MVDLGYLNTFLSVVKYGSFTKASYALRITQPAVSGHIAALEKELGVALFNRTGKRVVLTDAGRLVLIRAKDILTCVEKLNNELADLRALKGGKIRIGASKIVGVYVLPKILMAFREKFPQIELQISIHSARTIFKQIEDNMFDLAIIAEGDPLFSKNVGFKTIGQDKLIVIARPDHHLALKKNVSLEEICSEPFIMFGRNTASAQSILRQFKRMNVHLTSTIEIDEAGAIKRAVEEGSGIAIVSRSVVERELNEGRLVELPLQNWTLYRDILLLWRQDRRFSKNTEAFMRFLQRYFDQEYSL
ncbi:MAG: LysR family transcriptional regulator [Burkholderiaceae bacterium]|nr:LysR family transcriptional regulator [Burkholderiaceae bacterium]